MRGSRGGNLARILRNHLDQPDFAGIVEQLEGTRGHRRRTAIEIRQGRSGLAQHRATARMGILHIEDRVVLRLLDHLGEVKIECRVVGAEQHHETHRVATDLVDHLT